jgi:hypothetical protein
MSAASAFDRLGLPATPAAPRASPHRFPDGAHFRLEIPSVEGPQVLEAVVEAARRHGVCINRVSQGSGAMVHSESELRDMAQLASDEGIEVSLFIGPRAGFDVGAHARSEDGAGQYGQARGMRQLAYAVEDVLRSCEAGIRSFLIADPGLLTVLEDMRQKGDVPRGCVWKISVSLAPSNPASLWLLERSGATTVNLPSDLSHAEIAEMRATTTIPLDLYLETPDALGGIVRGQEIGDIVRVGAPLYAKFGLRNSTPLYPAGDHLVEEACLIAREKVRRAAVALEWLARLAPDLVQSGPGAEGLGVPLAGSTTQHDGRPAPAPTIGAGPEERKGHS